MLNKFKIQIKMREQKVKSNLEFDTLTASEYRFRLANPQYWKDYIETITKLKKSLVENPGITHWWLIDNLIPSTDWTKYWLEGLEYRFPGWDIFHFLINENATPQQTKTLCLIKAENYIQLEIKEKIIDSKLKQFLISDSNKEIGQIWLHQKQDEPISQWLSLNKTIKQLVWLSSLGYEVDPEGLTLELENDKKDDTLITPEIKMAWLVTNTNTLIYSFDNNQIRIIGQLNQPVFWQDSLAPNIAYGQNPEGDLYRIESVSNNQKNKILIDELPIQTKYLQNLKPDLKWQVDLEQKIENWQIQKIKYKHKT